MSQTRPKVSYQDFILDPRIGAKRELLKYYLSQESTPFMAIEESEIAKSLHYFSRHLPFIKLFYAVKANHHPEILAYLRGQGLNLDVASAGEVSLALAAGYGADQLILANPYKNEDALRALFENKIKMFTYDNEGELHRIADFRARHRYLHSPMSVLRLLPNQSTDVGKRRSDFKFNLASKFGASVDVAFDLMRTAKRLGLAPAGFSYHVGSNCSDSQTFVDNFAFKLNFIKEANKELNLDMRLIDIGGGFPNQLSQARGIEDLDVFYSEIAKGIKSLDITGMQIIAEPGRTIVGSSGTSVMTIIGKNEVHKTPWLILDDGVYGTLNAVVHDSARFVFFPCADKYYESQKKEHLTAYTLGGPTCDSFDTIATEVLLPRDLRVGDQLFVVDNGAYSRVTATSFNGFSPAKITYIPSMAIAQKRTS